MRTKFKRLEKLKGDEIKKNSNIINYFRKSFQILND